MNSVHPQFLLPTTKPGSVVLEMDVQLHFARIAWKRSWKSKTEKAVYFLQNSLDSKPRQTLVFDLSIISARMAELGTLKSRFGCFPLMAVKSFPFQEVIELATKNLSGFDISNWKEFSKIPKIKTNTTIFLSNPILEPELDKFLNGALSLNVLADSPHQLSLLQAQPHIQPGVRLNAASILASSDLRDASFYPISRFGMNPSEVVNYCSGNIKHGLKGIHVHHGSENNTPLTYRNLAKGCFQLAKRMGMKLQFLNLGGGLHHLSFPKVVELIEEIRTFVSNDTSIYIEPGRYYSTGSGFASGVILNTFEREGILYLVTELSSKCHLRWSEPKLILPIPDKSNGIKIIRICGPTCYESDFIGQFHVPAHPTIANCLKVGKRLNFANVSGYSAAWNTGFNGIEPAKIIFI
jgi:ornithine decarboxylase